ncbi:hypothetical protein Ocin01_19753, partial [Orchesella cincta]
YYITKHGLATGIKNKKDSAWSEIARQLSKDGMQYWSSLIYPSYASGSSRSNDAVPEHVIITEPADNRDHYLMKHNTIPWMESRKGPK